MGGFLKACCTFSAPFHSLHYEGATGNNAEQVSMPNCCIKQRAGKVERGHGAGMIFHTTTRRFKEQLAAISSSLKAEEKQTEMSAKTENNTRFGCHIPLQAEYEICPQIRKGSLISPLTPFWRIIDDSDHSALDVLTSLIFSGSDVFSFWGMLRLRY